MSYYHACHTFWELAEEVGRANLFFKKSGSQKKTALFLYLLQDWKNSDSQDESGLKRATTQLQCLAAVCSTSLPQQILQVWNQKQNVLKESVWTLEKMALWKRSWAESGSEPWDSTSKQRGSSSIFYFREEGKHFLQTRIMKRGKAAKEKRHMAF